MSTLPTARFDAFLYAAIEEDRNGMPLTVLSAFAREDLDPWDEAEALLLLGSDGAIAKLAEFLRRLPQGLSPRANSEAIAARLIPLLTREPAARGSPRRAPDPPRTAAGPAPPPPTLTLAETKTIPFLQYLLIYLLFVAVLIGSQWLSPSGESQTHGAATPSAAAAPSRAAPVTPEAGSLAR